MAANNPHGGAAKLTAAEQTAGWRQVFAFLQDVARSKATASPRTCPRCNEPSLVIIDRSARPVTEWYQLDCPNCGLSGTLSRPLSAPMVHI